MRVDHSVPSAIWTVPRDPVGVESVTSCSRVTIDLGIEQVQPKQDSSDNVVHAAQFTTIMPDLLDSEPTREEQQQLSLVDELPCRGFLGAVSGSSPQCVKHMRRCKPWVEGVLVFNSISSSPSKSRPYLRVRHLTCNIMIFACSQSCRQSRWTYKHLILLLPTRTHHHLTPQLRAALLSQNDLGSYCFHLPGLLASPVRKGFPLRTCKP
jgi:hypothetical protein